MQLHLRSISKFAARITVGAVTNAAITETLTHHTDLEEDSTTVSVVATTGGFAAQLIAAPYTDALVDRVADKLPRRKAADIVDPQTTETI